MSTKANGHYRVKGHRVRWSFPDVHIQPTLLGEWAVVINWGRIDTIDRPRLDIHNGLGEAIDAISEIKSAKVERGYLVCWT